MFELVDYCHLQEPFWKTTVTVIVNLRDSYVSIRRLLSFTRTLLEDHCHCHCQLQSLMLELEDCYHLQELFCKTTVTVIVNFRDSYVRIGRLLSFTRTLSEDHCHCHCQLKGLLCQHSKTTVIYKNSFGRPLSLSLSTSVSYVRIGILLLFTKTLLEDHCHFHHRHC